jgi:uncharacterized caspase-like protein
LNYAVPDAQALSTTISQVGTLLFRQIHVTTVLDTKATLAGIEQAFQQVATRITADDVFVLYLAGHGVTRDGRYYFLPQDFHRGAETVQPARGIQIMGSSPQDFRRREAETLQYSGVTQERLQAWLARIQAHRSMILIDTCESGSLVHNASALQVAIEKLSSATGRATMVAAMETQPALEGYKGHGVFTYVLLQALYYADQHYGNRDGMTSIFEIASHVDAHVPTTTREAFGVEQFSQVHILGRNFSIGTTSQK